MFQDEKKIGVKSLADDLEPYRRLVELQKQMIELVRQHEKTKSECTALREQLLDEMTSRRRSRWSLRRIISQPAAGWVKNLGMPETAPRKPSTVQWIFYSFLLKPKPKETTYG